MASVKPQCDPCLTRGTRNDATSFCTDCEEPLCSSCTDVHLSMKMLKNHHLVNIDVSSNLGINADRNCKKHDNMALDFFCTDHDELCCRSCLASTHKTCDNVLPVEVVAKNVKRSALFDSICDDFRNIESASNSFSEKKRSYKTKLPQSKSAIKKEIAVFKQKILKRIDDLEAKLIYEVDAIYQDLERQSDEDMQLIADEVRKFDGLKSQWSILTEHGSDIQIFVFLHLIKIEIPRIMDDLNNMTVKQKFQDVTFTEEEACLIPKSLGTVTTVDDSKQYGLSPIKLKSAQNTNAANTSLIDLSLESKMHLPVLNNSWITGIGATRDGLLVLCDRMSVHLILITVDGKHQQNIDLPGKSWNVTVDKESDTAFVTLPNESSVGIVNLTTRKFIKKFPCPGIVHGITTMKDGLAIGGIGGIYLCDHQGNITQTIKVGTQNIHSICLHCDNFVCCEADSRMVHKVTRNGDILFLLKEQMRGPVGITTDKAGLLYIVDCRKTSYCV